MNIGNTGKSLYAGPSTSTDSLPATGGMPPIPKLSTGGYSFVSIAGLTGPILMAARTVGNVALKILSTLASPITSYRE